MKQLKLIRLVGVMLVLLGVAACAKGPARVARPSTVAGELTAKAQKLAQSIGRQIKASQRVAALAWVRMNDGEEERETDIALALVRPDRARIDAMDALADVWAQAGTDGEKLWLFIPAKSKLYSGRATRGNLRRLAKFDWELPDLVALIAGTPPLAQEEALYQHGDPAEAHFVSATGLHVWSDRKTGLPLRCARYSGDQSDADFEATFSDYRKVDGVQFPYRVEAVVPKRGARLLLLYREVSFGREFEASQFSPPTGERSVVDLKDKP